MAMKLQVSELSPYEALEMGDCRKMAVMPDYSILL